MAGQFSYGYLKNAVKAHLDLEEDELEVMNINQRFHIFANEAIQQICHSKPKYSYFQFTAVSEFTPLVYRNGVLQVATTTEIEWKANGLTEPTFATEEKMISWYNEQAIYLAGQVITMPNDFIAFAAKKAFVWTDFITNKQAATKQHIMYLSDNEFIVHYAANYQIPYKGTWITFNQNDKENLIVPMPADLALTIPVYVASVCLQQRNLTMAQAKRSEFELALSRCKSTNLLENMSINASFV